MSAQLSAAETIDWTIDQLHCVGLFVDHWRGLPLHERAAKVSIAFLSMPLPERYEIGERFAALGANRAGEI